MKAISIKQPWASLIASGAKSIELRSWPFPKRYIGQDLLICASGAPSRTPDAAAARGRNPSVATPNGVCVAIVRVVESRPATPADESAAQARPSPGEYAWVIERVRDVAHVPVKGRLSFFDVDVDKLGASAQSAVA